jgi:hypothetical protein
MNTLISLAALVVSIVSVTIVIYTRRRSFRPIVTIAVKTHAGGNVAIVYDLIVRNSGAIPAKNIRIKADKDALASALGRDASIKNQERWLACFDQVIPFLQNSDYVSCSFGTTEANDAGFWKYGATIPVSISYEGWVAKKYESGLWNNYNELQTIRITDSDSFTGNYWSNGRDTNAT